MRFVWCAVTLMLVGIFVNPLGNALPRRWFHADRFPYKCYEWEREGKVYQRIAIQKWKDVVPDMSRINPRMVSKRLGALPTAAQVERLVQETCVAEFTHWALIFASPLILCFRRPWCPLMMLADILLFNLPFVLIQRYNRPQLVKLMTRLRAREERLKNESAHTVL